MDVGEVGHDFRGYVVFSVPASAVLRPSGGDENRTQLRTAQPQATIMIELIVRSTFTDMPI